MVITNDRIVGDLQFDIFVLQVEHFFDSEAHPPERLVVTALPHLRHLKGHGFQHVIAPLQRLAEQRAKHLLRSRVKDDQAVLAVNRPDIVSSVFNQRAQVGLVLGKRHLRPEALLNFGLRRRVKLGVIQGQRRQLREGRQR